MTICVVDASVAVAWAIESVSSTPVDRLFVRIADEGATIPLHWYDETLNALLVAERRARITVDDLDGHMENFELFPFTIDDETPRLYWREVVALARLRKLTVYDATYLELALRTGLPLATLDQDLASAARAESVPLLID